MKRFLMLARLLAGLSAAVVVTGLTLMPACAHEGHEHGDKAAKKVKRGELGLSAALDGQGRLWVVSKESAAAGDHVVLKHSSDDGKSWSAPLRVNSQPEAVAAPGEERPRLLFGSKNQLYVLWTRPGSKNYAGDIRFAVSTDAGSSFSLPMTINQDGQPISHRHATIAEDGNGHLYVVWIDRRDVEQAKAKGLPHPGASLYYAFSGDGGKHWQGDFKLSDASCDCCRLALQIDADGSPVLFWRQVFAASERDHALARLSPDGQGLNLTRATFDRWQVEACPDHGPALAISAKARHAVWFDNVGQSGKVFYGRLPALNAASDSVAGKDAASSAGKTAAVEGQRALPDGAEHADIVAQGQQVWLAWQQFDGKQNTIGAMVSTDGGNSFTEKTLASSSGAVDQPRLLLHGKQALLVWNTAAQGVVVRRF
jgi:hypothetical protein